jgi:hypothetical protein
MPSERNTSSKLPVNFVSQFAMRNLAARDRSEMIELRLRVCWVTQPTTGLAVTPGQGAHD